MEHIHTWSEIFWDSRLPTYPNLKTWNKFKYIRKYSQKDLFYRPQSHIRCILDWFWPNLGIVYFYIMWCKRYNVCTLHQHYSMRILTPTHANFTAWKLRAWFVASNELSEICFAMSDELYSLVIVRLPHTWPEVYNNCIK